MESRRNSYNVKPFSPFRKASVDLLNAASRKNMIHALIEVDITSTRQTIKKIRKEEKKYLSLIGYILFCTSKALDNYKHLQAYRDWRNKLIIFDDIDISTTVERKINDEYEVIPKIIRKANHKDMFEISEEIRKAKTEPIHKAEVYKSIKKYLAIPFFIRRFFFRFLDRFPILMKNKAGTIMVTSSNSAALGNAWGIPVASHTVNLTIGGIANKLKKINGSIVETENLCLTISFDHNIVDGAPASRFIRHLQNILTYELNNKK
jgi:pyruvate/2-oxoglutarate dehydrogenase complex dihydrolipoamide acyltransferase (E2) component